MTTNRYRADLNRPIETGGLLQNAMGNEIDHFERLPCGRSTKKLQTTSSNNSRHSKLNIKHGIRKRLPCYDNCYPIE